MKYSLMLYAILYGLNLGAFQQVSQQHAVHPLLSLPIQQPQTISPLFEGAHYLVMARNLVTLTQNEEATPILALIEILTAEAQALQTQFQTLRIIDPTSTTALPQYAQIIIKTRSLNYLGVLLGGLLGMNNRVIQETDNTIRLSLFQIANHFFPATLPTSLSNLDQGNTYLRIVLDLNVKDAKDLFLQGNPYTNAHATSLLSRLNNMIIYLTGLQNIEPFASNSSLKTFLANVAAILNDKISEMRGDAHLAISAKNMYEEIFTAQQLLANAPAQGPAALLQQANKLASNQSAILSIPTGLQNNLAWSMPYVDKMIVQLQQKAQELQNIANLQSSLPASNQPANQQS